MKHVIPFIRFTTYYTKMDGHKAMKILECAQPGDFILTVDKKKLTGMLIPGVVDHAALVVSKHEAAQMTHKDFTVDHILNVLFESDRAMLMRIRGITDEYSKMMVDVAMSLNKATYDVSFKFGVDALYCSELVFVADIDGLMGADTSDLAGVGQEYISPTGLLVASNVICVFDTDEVLSGLTGTEIAKGLQL